VKTTKEDRQWLWEHWFDVSCFHEWLIVLASPRMLEAMRRVPPRDHLLRMLDAYLPYAKGTATLGGRDYGFRLNPEERGAAALALRWAIERWEAPEISREVTQAARKLLRADGEGPYSDEDWDAHLCNPSVDDHLLWPEHVPPEGSGHSQQHESPGVGYIVPPVVRQEDSDTSRTETTSDESGPSLWRDNLFANVFNFRSWICVLASPRAFQRLQRVPPREHVLAMIDAYLPYAKTPRLWIWSSSPHGLRHDAPQREAAALALRADVERWTPPTLSPEIIAAARVLAWADAILEPEEGWDEAIYSDDDDETPLDENLIWPESPQFGGHGTSG